jgi:hypothetical protein
MCNADYSWSKKNSTRSLKQLYRNWISDGISGITDSEAPVKSASIYQGADRVKVVNPLEKPKTQLPVNFPPNYCSSLIEHHNIRVPNSSILSRLFIWKIPARHDHDRKGQKKSTPSKLKKRGVSGIFLGCHARWPRMSFHSILYAKAGVSAIMQSGMVLQCQVGGCRSVEVPPVIQTVSYDFWTEVLNSVSEVYREVNGRRRWFEKFTWGPR